MPIADALLHPGNRLLHGGTSDVALFGAQPIAATITQPDAVEPGYVTAFAGRSSGGNSVEHDTAAPAPIYSGAPAVATAPVADDVVPFAMLQAAAPQFAPPAPVSPAPTGSGSPDTAPVIDGTPADVPSVSSDGNDAAGNPFHAPVLEAVAPTAVADAYALTSGVAGSALAPVLAEAAVLAGTVETLATSVADTTPLTAVPNLTAAVDSVTATVNGLVSPQELLTPVQDELAAVQDVLAPVQDSVATTVQDSVATTVMPLVDHLAAASDQPLEGVTDVLAGTDPAAGIATLTAMVGSADVFELAETGIPAIADPMASTLNAVPLDAEAVSPLLGDHADATHDGNDLLHGNDTHLGIAGL